MSTLIQLGLPDDHKIPQQSLGKLLYTKLKENNPDKVALVDSSAEKKITYREVVKLSTQLASALKHYGLKKGEVISIVSENNWKAAITILAGCYLGLKINLLNPSYTLGELKRLLSLSRPVLIFCTQQSAKNVSDLKKELIFTFNMIGYESCPNAKNFDELLEDDFTEAFNVEESDMNDVLFLLASSGTTGLPKLVQLTHNNFRYVLACGGHPLQVDVSETDTLVVYLPISHLFGCVLCLASLIYNATSVLLDKFIPDKFLQIIQDYRVTKLIAVPPVLLFLLQYPRVNSYDCSSLSDIICGGATTSKDLQIAIEAKFNGVFVRQLYGCTEATGIVCILPRNVKKYGTVGKAANATQIKVCQLDTGKSLGPGEIGELLINSDGVMKGYLGNDTETDASFDVDGFLKTGDLGFYDDEGFFYIVDRLKDIIKYKAFQVPPAELENLILQHPEVKDVGVVGIPDERAGEVPLAFVVRQSNSNLSEQALISYVEENISVEKRLYGGVRFIDSIPKNSTGKILRKELRSYYFD